MSDAWLNQCGDTDSTRQFFSFTAEMQADRSWVITGDGDAADEAVVDRIYSASGAHASNPPAGIWSLLLDREMDPGWWLLELSVSGMIVHPFDGWWNVAAAAYAYTNFGATQITVGDAFAAPLVFDGTLYTPVVSDQGNASSACTRVLFIVDIFGGCPADGQPRPTITIEGTRLACPRCPEP